MEFSPSNPIVQLCLQGMDLESKSQPENALAKFMEAYQQATNDFEKFLASHYIARSQSTAQSKLPWLEKKLEHALNVNDHAVASAFPSLYQDLAACHESLHHDKLADEYKVRASDSNWNRADNGPFYHGTRADLKTGDLLTPGGHSNYKDDLKMNHIYFTALVNGAGLAAELARGDAEPRVYMVEPTGNFENDPNVTDKKFPGNPTRSYRSTQPLKIVGEVREWPRLSAAELKAWRDKLAGNKGEIIN